MCLSIEWKLYTSRNSNREQLRKNHQLESPRAGIEPTPVRFVDVILCVSTPGKLKKLLDRSGNRTRELWFASPMLS